MPIYVTVQWDQFTADEHPEWRQVTAEGALQGTPPYEAGFYRLLCLNSPYVAFLEEHLRDLFEAVPVDGLFLDIVKPQDCSCPRCRRAMVEKGLDPAQPAARLAFGREVMGGFVRDLTTFIRTLSADCTVFYNGGHVDPGLRAILPAYTHLELESLPSGGWGYLHFPLTVRYARTLGVDCLGMTGKFHTSWGDFHSYKNRAALEFECFQMLAQGARCSVGDQLHPSGRLDAATYELIGGVYARVEEKEPWCRSARPMTEIGVFSPEEFTVGRHNPAALGVTRLLQEGRHQFDVIDTAGDFSRYRVLVLPDSIPVGPALARRLEEYVAGGGALLASHRSGLDEEQGAFALPSLGIRLVGEAPASPDFLQPREGFGRGLPRTEHVMYLRGLEVAAQEGTEVLADVLVPYFNRAWDHFVSHRHTPSSGRVGYPGIVQRGRVVYFAHPVFTQYSRNAPRWCKTFVLDALDRLLPDPLVRVDGPSTLVATVTAQPAERRWIVHLLHYVPERRGQDFDVLEDVIPLFDLKVSLKTGWEVEEALLVPQGKRLRFVDRGGRVELVVPRLDGHQMVALRFW